jgi:predicted transcriptional regulator
MRNFHLTFTHKARIIITTEVSAMDLSTMRKEKRYSQTELGQLVAVSQQQIAKYECGLSVPRPDVMIKLAEIFELSPQQIWDMFYSVKAGGR